MVMRRKFTVIRHDKRVLFELPDGRCAEMSLTNWHKLSGNRDVVLDALFGNGVEIEFKQSSPIELKPEGQNDD